MEVIVIGNGGHSKVIQEVISSLRNYEIIAILDDKYTEKKERNGITYAPFSSLNKLLDIDVKVVIAIGSNAVRKKLVETLNLRTDQYLSVIHPTAVVSSTAIIGNGTVVMPNAVINADAEIGEHSIINTGAIVEHENKLANYVHISPNATLTGNVSLGEGVHIGASATIIPGIEIGQWSVIGAGSTVIHHISSSCKAVGSPAKVIYSD